MNQNSDYPKVDRVKITQTTDQIIQNVDRYQSTLPECLVKEILVSTGFQSLDNNAYKLIAHMTDKWLSEISESIISKKYGADRRKRDPENKPQITTEEVVNDLEQRGVRCQNTITLDYLILLYIHRPILNFLIPIGFHKCLANKNDNFIDEQQIIQFTQNHIFKIHTQIFEIIFILCAYKIMIISINKIMKLINLINGSFTSQQLESQFLDQQLSGIMEFYKLVTATMFFVYLYAMILAVQIQLYFATGLFILLAIINHCQYLFFKKRPSLKCLPIINMYNVLIACLRLYQALTIVNGSNFSYNDAYLQGTSYFTFHISLLINPYLTTNIIVISLIFLINMATAWIYEGRPYYQGFGMLFNISLLLWKIKIDSQTKRNMFILKQEKFKWENILKVLIEQPYVIINFVKEELKFNFVESNLSAKLMNINDSQSMREVLRKISIVHESRIIQQSLENYLFYLVENLKIQDQNLFFFQEIIVIKDKSKYILKIFPIDQDSNTLLLTFHNISQIGYQRKLQKAIVNQQIGFCNLIKEQYQFCQNLQLKLIKNSQSIKSMIQLRMYDLINHMSLFKTEQKPIIRRFNLNKIFVNIQNLFPDQSIYVKGSRLYIMSDYIVINQIFHNLFSLLNNPINKQVFMVQIQRNVENENNLVQIVIVSKLLNFEKIIQMQSLKHKHLLTLTNLVSIQKKNQFNFLIMDKLLRLVSPHRSFDFEIDYSQDTMRLRFFLYEDLSFIEQD